MKGRKMAGKGSKERATLPESYVKNWNGKGKEDALTLLRQHAKIAVDPLKYGPDFCSCLYDLLQHSVKGSLEAEDVAALLGRLTSSQEFKSLPSVIADHLSVLDVEVQCCDSKDKKENFKSLVVACQEIVPVSLLKGHLEVDTLEAVGIIPSSKVFNQKYVKMKTRLFFKQQKFNLFREESEGYSKLIAELGHGHRTHEHAPVFMENVKSLIGHFNLDPNRVLDVILDAFESMIEDSSFFLALLKCYPADPQTFTHILGNKFHFYQATQDGVTTCTGTPCSLYRLAAVLLQDGLVSLEQLYSHLLPSDDLIAGKNQSFIDDTKTKARKINSISLAERSSEDKQHAISDGISQSIDLESRPDYELSSNQKLGLCEALIRQGCWSSAKLLVGHLPTHYTQMCPAVVSAITDVLHITLEPLYRSIAPRAAKGKTLLVDVKTTHCSKFLDITCDLMDIMYTLGPLMSQDPILLAKVVRIGRAFFKDYYSTASSTLQQDSPTVDTLFRRFITLLSETILPSLSLLQCNCGMAEEVWGMIKQLPYEVRYQLYGQWKNHSYELYPSLLFAKAVTINRAKYIMKRLTKENVKPSGRHLGKLSHSNPGIVFDCVLSQIQTYDNLIVPVVDALKYLSPLGYDILSYCIIEALGNPLKERLKHEDTNISQWLQGLANFCGTVFKKYNIELTGLIQYVINQLKNGKSFDLLVLKEVVQKMSGVETSEDMTLSQLEALAGGELLKAEGAYFSQVRNVKKSSQRLRDTLVGSQLGIPLCLLMGQQRDSIIFREGSDQHLKLAGQLYDHCMDTLIQFGGFLSSHFSSEEYSQRLPSLDVLHSEYHIPADIAFFLLRPVIANAINTKFVALEKSSSDGEKGDKKSKSVKQQANYLAAVKDVMEPILKTACMLHSNKIWEDINIKLYTTFWSLSLYDLYVPATRYEEEVGKLEQAIKALDDGCDMASNKKKKEQEKHQIVIDKLKEEKRKQTENHKMIMVRVSSEQDEWFNTKVTKNRTITQFLQLCIFPRCLYTTADAVYCAKFIYLLHTNRTPNFSTLLFFDKVFSDISYTSACCTENEARRYGKFLGELLEVISRWHGQVSIYDKECADTPGFLSMMRNSSNKNHLDFENFRHICFKWHFKITKSLVVCLESKDYMQIRNALIVLTKLLPQYPKVQHLAIALDKRVEKIIEEEKKDRPDLFALATGYSGMLKAQKANLVAETDYHNKEERAVHDNVSTDTKLSGSRTKQEHSNEKMLIGDDADAGAVNGAAKEKPRASHTKEHSKATTESDTKASGGGSKSEEKKGSTEKSTKSSTANGPTKTDHPSKRTSDVASESQEPKRRKVEESKDDTSTKAKDTSRVTPSKEHEKSTKASADRKRERSSDKDSPTVEVARDVKKKKESPSSSDSPARPKTPDSTKSDKKRVIKIANKSESSSGGVGAGSSSASTTGGAAAAAKKVSHSPSTTESPNRKVSTVRKEKEDDKHKKHKKSATPATTPTQAAPAKK
ncbi:THO complex subunit 2-like isoform X2 [Dysidea avara]|uniref:THO complex subunit 2-like isoform X2 n=1 Tax=Dysidea avara TaxID=196820 RepID=UPI0033279D0F